VKRNSERSRPSKSAYRKPGVTFYWVKRVKKVALGGGGLVAGRKRLSTYESLLGQAKDLKSQLGQDLKRCSRESKKSRRRQSETIRKEGEKTVPLFR